MKLNMGMTVLKEAGAKWLTALYDKLRTKTSIVVNGFKKVGITEAVKKARETPLSDDEDTERLSVAEVDMDPFNNCSKAEGC